MAVIREIINRRSVRKFKPDIVPENLISEIIKAGQFAPSAMNNKSVEFIVVKNQKIKDEIFVLAGQDFVKEAYAIIIPVVDTNKSVEPVKDLSVASENMFLQAAALGLGTVWKNFQPAAVAKIKNILGIPNDFMLINGIPLGWPSEPPAPHTDQDFDAKKIHQEKW